MPTQPTSKHLQNRNNRKDCTKTEFKETFPTVETLLTILPMLEATSSQKTLLSAKKLPKLE